MKLIPWKKKEAAARGQEKGTGLGQLRSEMNRMFERFFTDPWGLLRQGPPGLWSGWAPSLDVVDGEKEVTVRAEVPGVDPREIELAVLGNTLTISGQKKESHEEKGKGFTRSECRYGSFQRAVELPAGVDPAKVTAEYSKGVLTVRVEKTKAAAAKRIPIATK